MSSPSPIRAGTIRRVIRRGEVLVCGMCRAQHRVLASAEQCVTACWAAVLAMDPVIARRHGLRISYRCRFCARDYRGRAPAEACAADCRRQFIARHDDEQDLTQRDEPAGTRRRFQAKPRPVLRAMPRPAPKPAAGSAAPPTVPAPAAGHGTDSATVGAGAALPAAAAVPVAAPPASAAPVPAPGAATDGGEGGSRWKDKDVFYRDGARYICRGCDTKYFTKADVFTCFEKHQTPG